MKLIAAILKAAVCYFKTSGCVILSFVVWYFDGSLTATPQVLLQLLSAGPFFCELFA